MMGAATWSPRLAPCRRSPRGTTRTVGLTSYTRLTYPAFAMVYNGLDQRVAVTAGTALCRFVYDEGGRLIGEYTTAPTAPAAEHIWLSPDADGSDGWQPLALAGATSLTWVHGDHLGTPVLLTDGSGTVVNAYDTTPFGQRWASQAASPTTALAQPGQLIDIADRYYNAHRDYDPTLGRYLQADPIGLEGGDNAYGYVGGNPAGADDPEGLYPVVMITYPDGTQWMPTSTVKNSAQARSLGVPKGGRVPIAVPPGVNPNCEVKAWRKRVEWLHFAVYWRPLGPHDYKSPNHPQWDAYGNFAYGATGAAAGFTDKTLQWFGDALQGGTNYPENKTDTVWIRRYTARW